VVQRAMHSLGWSRRVVPVFNDDEDAFVSFVKIRTVINYVDKGWAKENSSRQQVCIILFCDFDVTGLNHFYAL